MKAKQSGGNGGAWRRRSQHRRNGSNGNGGIEVKT